MQTPLSKETVERIYFPIAALLIINALFLKFNAFRGFNFFDMGPFLDASWRVFIGQKPYRDFIFTTGPVYLYLNAFFFFLFGFGKTAIWLHLVIVHSLAIVATFLIARKHTPLWIAYLTAVLSTACFYWPVSFPWYDQTAHLWGIIALTLIVYSCPLENSKKAFKISVICGILSAVSFLSKSNIGFAYGILFLITFASGANRLDALKGYFLGGFATLAVTFLVIGSPEKYIEQAFLLYNNNSAQRLRRVYALFLPRFWLMDFYWIPAVFILVNLFSSIQNAKKNLTLFILTIGIFFVAKFSAASGSLLPTANIPLLGVFMALAFSCLFQSKEIGYTNFQKWIFIITAGIMIAFSARRGLALDAWTYNGRNPYGSYPLEAKPFRGWLMDEKTGQSLDAAVNFVTEQIPKNESLLILTDLQILYPLSGRESFKGIPFIWAINELPSPGRQTNEVKDYILQNPPDWILTHVTADRDSDIGLIIPYLGLRDFVINSYAPVKVFGNYVIARRK